MGKTVYIDIDTPADDERALFVYIDSDRSDGKTTSIVRRTYDEYHRSTRQGVIARRYTTEASAGYANMLLTNLNKVRPDHGELTFRGSHRSGGIKLIEDGKPFAVLSALSKADSIKSTLDVATHKDLYIDEYVPITGHYIKDEMDPIMEIWQTIDRKTYTNKVIICSNRLSVSNPVFSYFDIVPRPGLHRYRNGRFIHLSVQNRGNARMTLDSPLADLCQGTPYLDYMTGGTLHTNDAIIHPKHDRGRLPFVIECRGHTYGLYYADVGLVLAPAEPRAMEPMYSTRQNGGALGTTYLPQARELYYSLRVRFRTSQIFADSEVTLYDARDIWQLLSRA